MGKAWMLYLLLGALLALPGCSTKSDPVVSVPAPPVQTEETALTPANLRERALSYMSQGAYEKATADWSALVQHEPTADNWNELSFAYLQAKRYQEAASAAESALKLRQDHPYALYNAGMAYLQDGRYCQALYPLASTAGKQPDRYEPHLALARGYKGTGQYGLAQYHWTMAAKLKGSTPEIQAVQTAVAEMLSGAAPADLAKASIGQFKDGALTLYLYPEKTKGCDGGAIHSLYLVGGNGQVRKVPVGAIRSLGKTVQIQKVALPDGYTGYWIDAIAESIAYVAHSDGWLLIAVKDQELRQVLFEGSSPGVPRDTLDSGGVPRIDGPYISAHRMDGASGTVFVSEGWELQTDLSPSKRLRTTYTFEGAIAAISGTVIKVQRVANDPYQRTLTLTDATQVYRNGNPVSRSELKAEVRVSVTFDKAEQVLGMTILE